LTPTFMEMILNFKPSTIRECNLKASTIMADSECR
jgi:hypothetical protein